MRNASILQMARNALVTAGHELGAEGEHWPVIKSALASLARSYEALKIEEEVSESLRTHMREALDNYEELLNGFSGSIDAEIMTELRKFVSDLREIYNARFDDVDGENNLLGDLSALASEIDGILAPADAAMILNQKRSEA